MGAALGRRDEVDVALGDGVLGARRPAERELDHIAVLLALAGDGLGGHALAAAELVGEIGAEVAREEPFVLLAGGLLREADAQARAEHGLRLQRVAQLRHGELVGVEELAVRPEAQRGAGVALADAADDLQLRGELAVAEADGVFLSAAAHAALEAARERVHHRDADAVQTAREAVAAAVELAARVQPREDELDAAHLLLGVDVDRHAAAVVGDLHGAVAVQRDIDAAGVTGQRLVDAVVDHLMREVVGPRGVGVHPRPAPHRLEPGEHLDRRGIVVFRHPRIVPRRVRRSRRAARRARRRAATRPRACSSGGRCRWRGPRPRAAPPPWRR